MKIKLIVLLSRTTRYLDRLFSDGTEPSLGRYISALLVLAGVVLLFKAQISEGLGAIGFGVGAKTLQNFTERGG